MNPSCAIIKIKGTGGNILYGTAQDTRLMLVRDTDDIICRKVKLSVRFASGL